MNIAILLAAGKSLRASTNKLWLNLEGKPLWTKSYDTLKNHPLIDEVIVVAPINEIEQFKTYAENVVPGGETRMQSFNNALSTISIADIIIDHNAANPFVTNEEITEVINAAITNGAAAVSHPAVDTIMVTEDGEYKVSLPREKIRLMQTPQAVKFDIIKNISLNDQTDLSSALLGSTRVKLIDASLSNKKITYKEDIPSRTFIGEDSHKFSDQGRLSLGGLQVETCPAMQANSDGDVILHAIGRALAQANNESFSDIADELCEQGYTDSTKYLEPLLERTQIKNLSINIEGSKPIIKDLPLRNSLAEILQIPSESIQIEAHSGEELSPFGKGEALKCTCVITI